MALYIGEDEVWKCPKHPSKRRRNGICPTCLRDRLGTLCPNCATVRPCSCSCATSSSTSSSSSSSSFSLFSSFSSSRRVTAPVDNQPKLRRSSSVAVPFKTTSFWGSFRKNKSRKGEKEEAKDELVKDLDEDNCFYSSKIEDFERMMMKSRSMRAPITSDIGGGDVKASSKGKFWSFPSPIQVFRQRSKVVQDRSPLQRF